MYIALLRIALDSALERNPQPNSLFINRVSEQTVAQQIVKSLGFEDNDPPKFVIDAVVESSTRFVHQPLAECHLLVLSETREQFRITGWLNFGTRPIILTQSLQQARQISWQETYSGKSLRLAPSQ